MNKNLVLVDCETCSLKGGILELGTRKLNSLEEVLTLSEEDFLADIEQEYFKNPIPIEERAYAVHGIDESMVAARPFYDPSDFYKRFYSGAELAAVDELATNLILVGYNVEAFDRKRLGLSDNHTSIDLLLIARLLCEVGVLKHNTEEVKLGNKLDTLVALYCSEHAAHQRERHGAAHDVYKTFLLLRWLITDPLPNPTLGELVFLSSSRGSKTSKKALITSIRTRE